MPKAQGSSKTGGRAKGTPNRKTFCLLQTLEDNKIDIVKEIAALLPQLQPEKKADVLLNLMNYVFPKRKAIEIINSDENTSAPQVIVTLPSNGYEVRDLRKI